MTVTNLARLELENFRGFAFEMILQDEVYQILEIIITKEKERLF